MRATWILIVLCVCAVGCSEGRSPEQAFEELRTAALADDSEAVVRLLTERARNRRLADLEARISEWRNDADALAGVAMATGMTSEEILGQPRLWVLSRLYRVHVRMMMGAFKDGRLFGVDYVADDQAKVRIELPGAPLPIDFFFEREGAQWCWIWDRLPLLEPPPTASR